MEPDYVNKYIRKKIIEQGNFIKISFYELRIKENLSSEETEDFIEMAKLRLEDIGYEVYLTGSQYTYNGITKDVEDNELLIAIKNEEE